MTSTLIILIAVIAAIGNTIVIAFGVALLRRREPSVSEARVEIAPMVSVYNATARPMVMQVQLAKSGLLATRDILIYLSERDRLEANTEAIADELAYQANATALLAPAQSAFRGKLQTALASFSE